MTINLQMPDIRELKPRIVVFGVGGGGGNAVNNMIRAGLQGVDFVVANTDAQALSMSHAERVVQMGVAVTEGLGAGSQPEVGRAAAEEVLDEITDHLSNTHMAFITAGMGGGTGTGAAPVVARAARESGILTVGVVTKPFHFEGKRRLALAEAGIEELQRHVDTLIVIPNQNLFRVANEKTTFADAFAMADQVLYSGVACITDLMVKEGLINLDFADVRSVMREMGKAMMGTGEANGEGRAVQAAEAAIANPLLDEVSMSGAKGLLISITGGKDLTLFEVDEAASRIREEVDDEANIILGATFDENMEGVIRVSVVATGIDAIVQQSAPSAEGRMAELKQPLRAGYLSQAGQANEAAIGAAEQAARQAKLEEELRIPPSAQEPQTAAYGQPAPQGQTPYPASAATGLNQSSSAHKSAYPNGANGQEQPQSHIVPPPVAPENAGKRMPRVEDFPLVAQRQIRAHEGGGESQNAAGEDRRSVGLLRRLANVGLGRSENEAKPQAAAQSPQHMPQPAPRAEPPQGASTSPVQQARAAMAPNLTPQQQGGDPQVRVEPSSQSERAAAGPKVEEEQLEIPAFLRRQAN